MSRWDRRKDKVMGKRNPLIPSYFSFITTIIVLVGAPVLGMLISYILYRQLSITNAAKIATVLREISPTVLWSVIIGLIIVIQLLLMRCNELVALLVLAAHLYLDWYYGMTAVAILGAIGLLLLFFSGRSPEHPWGEPRNLWLWGLFLVLGIYPALQGNLNIKDATFYYPNLILGAFVLFWLGTVVAHDMKALRRLLQLLAAFGALLALHTIILARTGIFLFGSSRFDAFLAEVAGFELTRGTGIYRMGAFFVDPNWNGTFFAMMFPIPLGLMFSSRSPLAQVCYFIQALVMLPALLFTYSAGASFSLLSGIAVFLFFVGRTLYRLQIGVVLLLAGMVVVLLLPSQLQLLFAHGGDSGELSLRVGAWLTAIRVMLAYPLMGVGLGLTAYYERADPYRVPEQYVPLAHPHNSYLEFGAMGGIPLLVVFVALLATGFWQAIRLWLQADSCTRSFLAGGLTAIAVLSINSVSINAWTLPPLAGIGWFLLGAISSPLLKRKQESDAGATTNPSVHDLSVSMKGER